MGRLPLTCRCQTCGATIYGPQDDTCGWCRLVKAREQERQRPRGGTGR